MAQNLRFGIMPSISNIPWATMVERWKYAEAVGFDSAWLGDHFYSPFRPDDPFFEAWSLLAGLATQTTRIRIGTLVSNIILRHPALLAKQALTVDHISHGRLELGIGAGVFPSDHAALGTAVWPPAERVARFREVVEIVDRLLRREATDYHGRYYHVEGVQMHPGPVQQPRPPLTIAAHGPAMPNIAAAYGDAWSSFGGFGLSAEESFSQTRGRSQLLDAYCEKLGRNPREIVRSLLVYRPLDPWASPDAFQDLIARYQDIGITEFILYWPREGEPQGDFERIVEQTLPKLRNEARAGWTWFSRVPASVVIGGPMGEAVIQTTVDSLLQETR